MKVVKVRGFEAKFTDQMAEKIQRFLISEKISREDIISLTLTSSSDYCRCVLMYEQEGSLEQEK